MKKLVVSSLLLAGLLGIGIGGIAANGQSAVGDPFTAGLRQVAAGLTSPVALVEPPDGSRRLFIVDQTGLIRVLLPGGQPNIRLIPVWKVWPLAVTDNLEDPNISFG